MRKRMGRKGATLPDLRRSASLQWSGHPVVQLCPAHCADGWGASSLRFCRTWDAHITICRDSRKAKNTLTGLLLWYRSTIERDTVRCSDMTLQNRDKGRWSGNPAMHWSRWWRVKQRYRLIRSTSYNREMQSSLGPLVKVSMPVDYIRIHLVGCRGCIPITWVGTRLKL